VDYAAAIGTPIMATGDGTVIRAGRWGGYGIVVAIQHARGIETRYAHMRSVARGIRPGVRVTQGQTIGYVGMSGLANGPHLHYEFIQNGRHIDPREAVRFGNGDPVPEDRRAEFEVLKARFDRMLESARPLQVAAGTP
jgi:murein DD-endopeptidase MepM/ murein hydrolase activator NlpD